MSNLSLIPTPYSLGRSPTRSQLHLIGGASGQTSSILYFLVQKDHTAYLDCVPGGVRGVESNPVLHAKDCNAFLKVNKAYFRNKATWRNLLNQNVKPELMKEL